MSACSEVKPSKASRRTWAPWTILISSRLHAKLVNASKGLLDPCPQPVERLRKEPATLFRIGLARDDRGVLRRAILALTHFWWSQSAIRCWSAEGINAVQPTFKASTLVPRGFIVDDAT